MMTLFKKSFTLSSPFFSFIALALLIVSSAASMARAQNLSANSPAPSPGGSDGIALSPARFELEMAPGSETTVVVNLDYHTARADAQAYRLVASLNDWDMSQAGALSFYKAGTRPNSASPWMIYSPSEITAQPGQTNSIRVTISVPKTATPGDHLAALIVEQRPDTIKFNRNARAMLMRFRMAAIFYIKIPQITRHGTLENLKATSDQGGIIVIPTLKNAGNSMIRPTTSLKIVDSQGRTVAELPDAETLPILSGSELSQPLVIEKLLQPGAYTVSYRVDFQNGSKVVEGVTDLVVKESLASKPVASLPPPK
jgi:hypothetical protein